MLKGNEETRDTSGPVIQSRSASGALEYLSSPPLTDTCTGGCWLGITITGCCCIVRSVHAMSPTVSMNMRINITDGHENTENVSGKHSIPGGHRLGISNGAIGFLIYFLKNHFLKSI